MFQSTLVRFPSSFRTRLLFSALGSISAVSRVRSLILVIEPISACTQCKRKSSWHLINFLCLSPLIPKLNQSNKWLFLIKFQDYHFPKVLQFFALNWPELFWAEVVNSTSSDVPNFSNISPEQNFNFCSLSFKSLQKLLIKFPGYRPLCSPPIYLKNWLRTSIKSSFDMVSRSAYNLRIMP